MAGRGKYYEEVARYYFTRRQNDNNDYFDRNERVWTMRHSSGNYFTYTAEEPEKPDYQTGDSVFHQMGFIGDSVYFEQRIVLHKLVNKNSRDLWTYDYYRREKVKHNDYYTYRFDKSENIISVFDRNNKLYKKFSIVMMHPKAMVIELQQ